MGHTLIYGGTFDPIHHGHLITCQKARELVAADRVLFIPAWISPHKQQVRAGASGEDRLKMVHLAIARHPYFVADGREILRGTAGGGVSYTVETVESLRLEMPREKWTMLVGADQLAKFHTWHRVKELLGMVEVAVLGRTGGAGGGVLEEGLGAVGREMGGEIADRLRRGVLATPVIEISATEVRERVAAGLPIDYLVPLGVADYIRQRGLYR